MDVSPQRDETLEARFEREGQIRAQRGARIYCSFALALLLLNAAYSWVSEAEVFVPLLEIRLAAVVGVAAILWVLGTRAGERWPRPLMCVVMIIMTYAMHQLATFSGGQASSQYDRMSLVILGTAALMTWSAVWAAIACAAVLAVYVGGSAAAGTAGGIHFVENLGRLMTASVVSIGASLMSERHRWRDLWHQQVLAETHERAEKEIRRLDASARAAERVRIHQEELAHAQRISTMGQMAAQIAHEVNQPLGAIVNYANGLRRRLQERGVSGELVEAVERIAAEGLRAAEVLRRVRDFLRHSADTRELTDLNHLVREAVGLVEPDARQHHIPIQLNLSSSLGLAVLDPIQLEQVILNLLRNALEAMAASPRRDHLLVVETAEYDDRIEVQVCDTGVGVDPATADRIFDAFFTTKSIGLGMGLSVSRSIVEAHDGHLQATDNPGGGMTFTVSLPRQPEDAVLAAS